MSLRSLKQETTAGGQQQEMPDVPAGFAAVLAVAFLAAAERPQLLSTQFSTDEMLTVG